MVFGDKIGQVFFTYLIEGADFIAFQAARADKPVDCRAANPEPLRDFSDAQQLIHANSFKID